MQLVVSLLHFWKWRENSFLNLTFLFYFPQEVKYVLRSNSCSLIVFSLLCLTETFYIKSNAQIQWCCSEVLLLFSLQGPQEESVQEPRWRPGSLVLHYRSLCALGILQREEMLFRSTNHPKFCTPGPFHSRPKPFHSLSDPTRAR